ncbi:cytochrome C oxidase subunit IV family protein [Rhodohalobacter sp.]|uniref:cytochrome C oxidase subunit IV family protein n=1 Tax=Rhodohalobacter sp. TaxID=1974210 RepID=UPI002ACED59D|nr:cytochrome C oxidase subunit IV family protein [Rhodohalobacter sp.]MDZ7757820.1 cytochrome C oxidase subunit IV family protein [Rhodohalobacter sp.]
MSGHHISSAKFLWGIAITLFFLTFVTVGVTWIEIPAPWNVVVAIGIAIVKALLVLLFFMNLYWDSKFNSLLFVFSIIFFLLLIGITLLDTMYRVDPVPSF